MSYKQPYAGLKIIDISQGLLTLLCGNFCTLRAQVIKVEPPEGDWIRGIGVSYAGQTPLAMVANLINARLL